MNIWVLEIGEPLPIEGKVRQHRYGQFTRALSSFGHDVTWWTSSFSHAPKKNFVDKDEERIINGVRLKLMYSEGYRRNVSLARIRHNRLMADKFKKWAARVTTPDLVIAPVPTIETAEACVQYASEKKVPVLLDIRDLWPDELKNLAPEILRPLARMALTRSYRRMGQICRQATGIMGVSQSYMEYGLEFAGRPAGTLDCVFPLGYASLPVSPESMPAAREWTRQIGLDPSAFICCFFGTIGRYFDLGTVIGAAKILEKEFKVQFLLGGDGSSIENFRAMASGVSSVIFPGWLDAPKLAAVMEISKAGLAPYAKGAAMSLPNKPFEYMAGGLPVVSSIQHELKDILAENLCGKTYRADSVDELCQVIRELRTNDVERIRMGQNGRRLLEEKFATEKVFQRMNEHFTRVVNHSSCATR